MADELFEVRDGELSDDEPFYINPKDERSSYPFTDGELMEDVKRFFRAYIFAKPSREDRKKRVGWCYFPGAKVSFQMTIDLVGDAAKPEDVQKPKRLALSLEDIL